MRQSQQIAAAVALRAPGRNVKTPTGVLVNDVITGMPAVGKLQPTDVIVGVDGKPSARPPACRAMRPKRVGDRISFTDPSRRQARRPSR